MRLVGAALALAAAAGMQPVAAQPVITLAPGEALLSVEATGSFRAQPDTMMISAGTVTVGATAPEAVAANAALAQRVIEVVRGAGIQARDVRTSQFNVRPSFEGNRDGDELGPDGRPPRIVGYVVENRFEIRLRDLSNAQPLISRLFEAGANSVGGPQFSLADERQALRSAERDAIDQARAEAENYAAAIGRRIGRILRISDRRAWTEEDEDQVVYVMGNRSQATPIEPGEVQTRAVVHVDFALAPQ